MCETERKEERKNPFRQAGCKGFRSQTERFGLNLEEKGIKTVQQIAQGAGKVTSRRSEGGGGAARSVSTDEVRLVLPLGTGREQMTSECLSSLSSMTTWKMCLRPSNRSPWMLINMTAVISINST